MDLHVRGHRSGWSVLAGCLLAGCGAETPQWCVPLAGATTIVMGQPTMSAIRPLLMQAWEVEDVGGERLRGPSAVAVSPGSGMIAVADHVTTSVTLISRDGKWARRWSRPGRGRGELSHPAAMTWMADGSLAVLDPGNRKILRFDSTGVLIDESFISTTLAAGSSISWALMRTSDVVRVASRWVRGTDSNQVVDLRVLWSHEYGSVIDTILAESLPLLRGENLSLSVLPGSPIPMVAPWGDSLLAVAGDIAEFRIRVMASDGRVVRQICRVSPPVPFSEPESTVAARLGRTGRPSDAARIGRLFADGDGRIWAQRDRVTGVYLQDRWFGPLGATFDVLDSGGTYLGQVRAPDDTRLAAADGSTVIGFRVDSVGRVSVVSFRVIPGWQ